MKEQNGNEKDKEKSGNGKKKKWSLNGEKRFYLINKHTEKSWKKCEEIFKP